MKRTLLIIAAIFLLGSVTVSNAAAQANGRIMQFTLLLDYARGTVQLDGAVTTPDGAQPDLSAWGFAETLPSWQDASRAWNVRGSISGARVLAPDSKGVYHVEIDSLVLARGDKLTLKIPFVNLDYARIEPPPDDLPALTSPSLPPDLLPGLLGLQYDGGTTGRTLALDVPFTLVRKQITLQATPLIGEMLLGRTDSFRIAGRVVFDGLVDYGEFTRHCANDPASRVQYRYRVADLLFALDGMPIYNSGLLGNAYQWKPNYLLASVDLSSCQFDAARGRVEANFNGRAFSSNTLSPLPPAWFPPDQADSNTSAAGTSGGAYELSFGNVVLAPGDILTVTVPAAEIRSVQPPPTRYRFSTDRAPEIAYDGPARITLRITYAPQPELFLHQIPATGRVLVRSFEAALRPLLDPRGALLTWSFLIVGLICLAARRYVHGRAAVVVYGIGWVLAALALYFGLRGAFGLLVLAVLVYIDSLKDTQVRSELIRAAVVLALILAAMYVDAQSENLFTLLTTLQLESTPVTPIVFLALGLALTAVVALSSRVEVSRLFPRINSAVVLVLIAFASFDVLQKSFLGLAVIGLGMWYVAHRGARSGDKMQGTEVVFRIRSLWKSRFVPLGVVLMILFAAQNGLQSTTAVLGSSLGLLGTIAMPVLLLISIIQGFLAIGALFILLYPLLPFKAGYLKALALALFLLTLFIVGTGADDRLVSTFESLIVGRLVYYVSVPLLIGLYYDIIQFMRTEQDKSVAEGKAAAPLTIEQAAPMYFKRVQGLIGTVGALASLVAPGAYALFAGTPLVTTYFDILGKLASVSLGT